MSDLSNHKKLFVPLLWNLSIGLRRYDESIKDNNRGRDITNETPYNYQFKTYDDNTTLILSHSLYKIKRSSKISYLIIFTVLKSRAFIRNSQKLSKPVGHKWKYALHWSSSTGLLPNQPQTPHSSLLLHTHIDTCYQSSLWWTADRTYTPIQAPASEKERGDSQDHLMTLWHQWCRVRKPSYEKINTFCRVLNLLEDSDSDEN